MKAYVTLLSNRSYLKGVLVLCRSLKAVQAQYPLYCVLSVSVEDDVQKELEREGIRCIRLVHAAVDGNVNPEGQGFSHWNFTFDKLLIWGLTQFEKVVFLDSDMLIVRNIDGLFEREPFSAVCADSSYPGNEGWAGGLNSGLMVIAPDKETEKQLLQCVKLVVEESQKQNKLVGDQDVVKYFISDFGQRGALHLDEGYNIFADHLTYYIRHLGYSLGNKTGKPIYVVHFIGKAKPWMKKTLRQYVWLLKMCLGNPHYVAAYRKYMKYLRK